MMMADHGLFTSTPNMHYKSSLVARLQIKWLPSHTEK